MGNRKIMSRFHSQSVTNALWNEKRFKRQHFMFTIRPFKLVIVLTLLAFSPGTQLAAHADTVAQNIGSTSLNNFDEYFGQSFTVATSGPVTNIKFSFLNGLTATYAIGNAFLLSSAYTGMPTDLSISTPGFLGEATASGNQYTFAPSLTLQPGTQYFLYENALIPQGSITGGNTILGGEGFSTGFSTYTASGNFAPFILPIGASSSFLVTGTPATVPEASSLLPMAVGLMALSSLTFVARRRKPAP